MRVAGGPIGSWATASAGVLRNIQHAFPVDWLWIRTEPWERKTDCKGGDISNCTSNLAVPVRYANAS